MFKIRDNLEDFPQAQEEIVKLSITIDADADLTPLQDTRDEISNEYYYILSAPAERKATDIEQSNISSPSLDSEWNPDKDNKTSLPTFNGLIKYWPRFKVLIFSLKNDNESIFDIQKFQYLLPCLINEPHNPASYQ